MESNPLVSIIIPVYNGSNYLRCAIDSALAQEYENLEIIVVNDGSNDGGKTEEIALSYGEKIRYFSKPNGGVSSALNYGISKMRGDYFSWLSHDDMYSPKKIRNQVELLVGLDSPDSVCICENIEIDQDSKPTNAFHPKRSLKIGEVSDSQKMLYDILTAGCFNGCTLLIPAGAFKKCGGFDESLRYVQDFLMWIEIALAGYSVIYSDEPDVFYRVHNGQLTQRSRELYHKESYELAVKVADRLSAAGGGEYDFVYLFALQSAKYDNKDVVREYISVLKRTGHFSFIKIIRLRSMQIYGKVRPAIRRLYYSTVKKVKTQ